MTTYTAQVGPDNAARLAVTGGDGESLFSELGGGVVQINDLDRLRARAHDADGYLTDDEEGLQIWIDGESYPVFDDFESAVADALGLQNEYDLAKRAYDRAVGQFGAAVAKVVALAASPQAAASALGMDEMKVQELAGKSPLSS